MIINELTKKVLEFAQSNKSGFTLNIETLQPIKNGFVASYKATQNSFSSTDLQTVVNHALKHDCIIGGWYNSEDKRYYFDSNRVFDNLIDAIEFGIINEQLAIFDLDTKKEIRLDNPIKGFDFSTFAEWLLNTALNTVKYYRGDILLDVYRIVELRNEQIFSLQDNKPQYFSLYWGVRKTGTWICHREANNGFTVDEYLQGLGAQELYLITFRYDTFKNEVITVERINKESI